MTLGCPMNDNVGQPDDVQLSLGTPTFLDPCVKFRRLSAGVAAEATGARAPALFCCPSRPPSFLPLARGAHQLRQDRARGRTDGAAAVEPAISAVNLCNNSGRTLLNSGTTLLNSGTTLSTGGRGSSQLLWICAWNENALLLHESSSSTAALFTFYGHFFPRIINLFSSPLLFCPIRVGSATL